MIKIQYAYDEACIVAAFLRMTCLYGVPAGNLCTQTGKQGRQVSASEIDLAEWAAVHLRDRVVNLVKQMEAKRLLVVEPGGTVYMDEQLCRFVKCMGRAQKMGYIVKPGKEEGRIYLYCREDIAVAQKSDGKGGAWFYLFERKEEMSTFLKEAEGSLEFESVAVLIFEKKEVFYEPVLDGVWKEEMAWDKAVRAVSDELWKNGA